MTAFTDKYGYAIGKAYPTRRAQSADDYLQAALRGERYLAYHQRNSADGIYWLNDDSATVDLSFFTGIAGISYFYTKLYRATGEERFRTIAVESGRYLARHWKGIVDTPPVEGWFENLGTDSFYGGASGIGIVLLNEYRELGEEELLDGARDIATWLVAQAHRSDDGSRIYWSGRPAVYLDAGLILFLIQLRRVSGDDALDEVIAAAGEHLLDSAIPTDNGGLDFDVFHGVQPFNEPNFELGASGAGYTLNRLYEATGDVRYLDAARKVAVGLERWRVPQSKGSAILYRIYDDGTVEKEGDHTVFYLGLCHGPAGTSRFYYELARNTGDASYLDVIADLVDGQEALGVPEHQYAGFWNAVHYCCGNAGLVHFYIGLYLSDGNERWHDLAVRAGDTLLGSEEIQADGSSAWPLAFTRVEPDVFDRYLGYYPGVAGIASALLELYLLAEGRFDWPRLEDDPFPETQSDGAR